VSFTDQVSPELGKFSLAEVWKPLEQFLAGYKTQRGVAEELKLLVVADARQSGRLGRLQFACLRAMRQRLLNEFWPGEVIAEVVLESGDIS
jgi:hypothetical protein